MDDLQNYDRMQRTVRLKQIRWMKIICEILRLGGRNAIRARKEDSGSCQDAG